MPSTSESDLEYRLHLNEPGRPAAQLLETLLRATDAVTAGEEICVAFYYLRNRRLCSALADARERGVRVRILISGRTHVAGANREALRYLRERGFGSELRVRHRSPLGLGRMHLKLFLASRIGERRHVIFTGTYNPSGDDRPEPELIRRIGDQDRGYNYLLELSGSAQLFAHLAAHFDALHGATARSGLLFPAPAVELREVSTCTLPTRPNPLLRYLEDRLAKGPPGHLRIATSHLSHRGTIALLGRLRTAGHRVEIIGHDSQRRFSRASERRLRRAGVEVCRYVHPELFPMHCKFVLSAVPDARGGTQRELFLGSMNLNFRSYYFNDDLLLRISHPEIYREFAELWQRISAAIAPRDSVGSIGIGRA